MYIVLIPRTGVSHIFNFLLSNGQYRTLCNVNVSKEKITMTLGCDAPFPGICPNCIAEAHDMYQEDLDIDPSIARNNWQMMLEGLRHFHYDEILGPSSLIFSLSTRNWNKLSRAKIKYTQSRKKK